MVCLAIKTDGSLVAWGSNSFGQCNVPSGSFSDISTGANFGIALASDGSILAWGQDAYTLVSTVPSGTDFSAISANELSAVALKSDGSLVAWGHTNYIDFPSGLPLF